MVRPQTADNAVLHGRAETIANCNSQCRAMEVKSPVQIRHSSVQSFSLSWIYYTEQFYLLHVQWMQRDCQ